MFGSSSFSISQILHKPKLDVTVWCTSQAMTQPTTLRSTVQTLAQLTCNLYSTNTKVFFRHTMMGEHTARPPSSIINDVLSLGMETLILGSPSIFGPGTASLPPYCLPKRSSSMNNAILTQWFLYKQCNCIHI